MARQAAPVLTYTIAATAPMRVQERLSIFADGNLWYWSLSAAATASQNRAGTFMCALDTPEVAAAHDLAAALMDLPSDVATAESDDLRVAVTARVGERERTAVLSFNRQTRDLSPLARARDHLPILRARAEQHPLSAVRLSVESARWSPGVTGSAPPVRFIFESIGSKEVCFLLRPDSFVLRAHVDGVWQTLPRQSQGTAMSLISPDAQLIDGVHTPARLKPGRTAAASFFSSVPPTTPEMVQGFVDGMMVVLEPHTATPRIPRHPFSLVSAPRETHETGGTDTPEHNAGML